MPPKGPASSLKGSPLRLGHLDERREKLGSRCMPLLNIFHTTINRVFTQPYCMKDDEITFTSPVSSHRIFSKRFVHAEMRLCHIIV